MHNYFTFVVLIFPIAIHSKSATSFTVKICDDSRLTNYGHFIAFDDCLRQTKRSRTFPSEVNFQESCQEVSQVGGCMAASLPGITCFSEKQRENFVLITNAVTMMFDKICANGGDTIEQLYNSGDLKCIDTLSNQLGNCARTMQSNGVDVVLDMMFTEKECSGLNDLRSCAMTAFQVCKPNVVDIINNLIKSIADTLPCNKNE